MSVYRRPGQAFYSYDFRWRGARFSGSTGRATKREAERFEQAERERIKAAAVDTTKPLPFQAAAALYWEEKGKHLANSADELRTLEWLTREIGAQTPLSSITDAVIARLVAKRRGERKRRRLRSGRWTDEGLVSPSTVNRTVTQPLRAILRRAERVWKQRVERIEWGEHFLPEPQERVREASQVEEAALLQAVRGDYAPALRFAILTGCRREEIVGLRWRDVNFFASEFTVTGKGDKSRTIPLTKAVRALLWAERPAQDDPAASVFTYRAVRPRPGVARGTVCPITMEGFKTEWRRARKRAGIADFRFHDTRHTAATRLVRATGNLKLAKELLGHSDLATTSRYAHVTKEDLRAGLEAVSASGPQTVSERAKQENGQ